MSTSQALYWFHVSGENIGPLTVDQTRKEARASRITVDTWAWYDGLESWQPARELPDLLRAVPELDNKDSDRGVARSSDAVKPYDERLADFGHRVIAGIIDTLFLGVVSVGLLQISGNLQPILAGSSPP